MSAGSAIRPSWRKRSACFSPRPSMSIVPRETKCLTCWKVWPGQPRRLGQIVNTASLGLDRRRCRTPGTSSAGCALRRRFPLRFWISGEITWGITSPARVTTTSSPLADVLSRQVLLVVERRGRDRDAADVDRLEHRERDQAAVAADVPDDLVELRRRGDRRELPRDRPARLAADDAQLAPQRALVDLDHDAVDLGVEALAALLPPLAALDDLVDRRRGRRSRRRP